MANTIAFDEQFYLQQNPDVAAAVSRGLIASAAQHFDLYGRFESRNPNAFFNTSFYLGQYPDVAKAGINPLTHFLTFGVNENRAVNASELSSLDTDGNGFLNEFNKQAYLDANPDVKAAGIDAYKHFIQFGQFEGRAAPLANGTSVTGPFTANGTPLNAGSTLALTTGVDNLKGTSGNDTFNADHTTLQATDVIDGGAGTKDVFNFTDGGTTGGALPAAQVRNVETINVRNVNGTAAVAATNEVATINFSDVTAANGGTDSTLTVAGTSYDLGNSGASYTGANLAAYFSTNVPSGYTFVSLSGNQLVLRATTAGNQTDATAVFSAGGAAFGVTPAGTPGTGSNPGVAIVQGTNAVSSTGVVDTLSATNFVGATDFNSTNSTNGVTINDLTQGQSVGIVGNGTTNNGALTANYAASATAATVNVVGGTTGSNATVAVTGTGLTSATINSTGAANTLNGLSLASTVTTANIVAATNLTTGTVTANGLTTLNVSGTAAKVDVGQLTSAVTKVDASGLSQGGLTATLDAAITSFKGGQGGDVVTTASLTSTTAGIIDGSAGTDTLVVAAGTITTAAQGAQYVNFETLRVGASQDVSLVSGITGVEVSATGSVTTVSGLSAAQAGNIKVLGAQTSGLTLTLANATGSSDVVSLTLANPTETATTKAAAGIALLSVVGVETLNVQSASGDTSLTGTINSLSFASTGADKLSTINLTGDRSIDLSLTNVASAVTVNDSLSGSAALKVSAGASIAGSVINGTANADDITLASVTGNGVVTYNLGAGNDVVKSTAANLANHAIDFGTGTDTLSITDTTAVSLVDAAFQRVTNLEKVSFASTTGNLSLTSGGFFDSNFKAAGIELSATALTTGGANINLASFTGNATVTTSATGNSTQSITTGSGNDIIKIGGGTGSTLTVVSGAGNDTITITGAVGAIVTAGLGADTINAGAGNDTFKFNYGDSVVTSFDTITGLSLGSGVVGGQADVLSFQQASNAAVSIVALTTAQQTSVSGAANLSAAVNAVAAIATADGATTQFTYGTDTYIFHSGAATTATGTPEAFNAATDHLVKVTGVTGTLDASDIAIYQ